MSTRWIRLSRFAHSEIGEMEKEEHHECERRWRVPSGTTTLGSAYLRKAWAPH